VQWLLVLVVLWGAVLIPPWIADRCRDRPVQTMASFTRRLQQLEQLEHAPYASQALARDSYDDDAHGDGYGPGVPTDGYGYGYDYGGDEHLDADDAPVRAEGSGVSRAALRRRRQVFFLLLTAVAASLGALLALRTATAVYVHVGALVLFTTYVTLLVRHHQRATERVSKVRYLSPIRAPRPAVVVLRSGTAR
jgi:hypothetical protein